VEAELRDLDPDEAEEMRNELGIERSGLERLIRAAFDLLDLVTFFTADTERRRRRDPAAGGTAYDAAAGGDIQRAFVRAEVIAWDELWTRAATPPPATGTLRIEGRDYVVQDGDVVRIRPDQSRPMTAPRPTGTRLA
jgi:ribosome-binding ATPase YchF (GTP1/OBG family)